jgi:hypothetical protein
MIFPYSNKTNSKKPMPLPAPAYHSGCLKGCLKKINPFHAA